MNPLQLPSDPQPMPPIWPIVMHLVRRAWPSAASALAAFGVGLGVANVPEPPAVVPGEGRLYAKGYRQGVDDGVERGRAAVLAELDFRDPSEPLGVALDAVRGVP